MSGMNKAILIGRLTADPELRHTTAGTGVLSARMATNESWVTDGERKERTEFHNIVIWGKRGEGLNKVLSKGSQLAVEGRIQTRSWEDKQGGKRYTTEIVAINVVLLGGGNGGKGRRDEAPPPGDDYGAPAGDSGGGFGDDDIPF